MARPGRGATDLAGVLVIDKPPGMTSHDVVAAVRRVTGERRVGHAGTLDPLATGVLLVLVGPYTRLERYLASHDKEYVASVTLGTETDTDDSDGETTVTAPVPPSALDADVVSELLSSFLGTRLQLPPAYSAIKVGGRTAHRAARSGAPLELTPRPVEISEAALLDIDAAHGVWKVRFRVSKGTYIRALARDLGRAIGCAAHLSALRRTASGRATLRDAVSLDDVGTAAGAGRLTELFTDPTRLLGLHVASADARTLATGSALPAEVAPDVAPGEPVAILVGGRLAAVYRMSGDSLKPETVLGRIA